MQNGNPHQENNIDIEEENSLTLVEIKAVVTLLVPEGGCLGTLLVHQVVLAVTWGSFELQIT